MRRTNLRGHALQHEGAVMIWRDTDEDGPAGWTWGYGLSVGRCVCECGTASPVLMSNAARKRWHADHKNQLRADAFFASPSSVPPSTDTEATE